MSEPWMPADVYFGGPAVPLPDWRREDTGGTDDSDEPSEEERESVRAVLGFDPRKLDAD